MEVLTLRQQERLMVIQTGRNLSTSYSPCSSMNFYLWCSILCNYISLFIHLELSLKELCVRSVTNCNKYSLTCFFAYLSCNYIPYFYSSYAFFLIPYYFLNNRIPNKFYLFIFKCPLLQNL